MEVDFTDLKQLAMELKREMGIENHETLKLERNTRGYNWEIKIFMKSQEPENDLNRLEFINDKMIEKFTEEKQNE